MNCPTLSHPFLTEEEPVGPSSDPEQELTSPALTAEEAEEFDAELLRQAEPGVGVSAPCAPTAYGDSG